MFGKMFIKSALAMSITWTGWQAAPSAENAPPSLAGVALGESFVQFEKQEFLSDQQLSVAAACIAGTDKSDRCKNYIAVRNNGGLLGCLAGDAINALCQSFSGLLRFTDGKVSKVGQILGDVPFTTLQERATAKYGAPTTVGTNEVVWKKDGYSYTLQQNTDDKLQTHNLLILAADTAPGSRSTTLTGLSAPMPQQAPASAPIAGNLNDKPHSAYVIVEGIALGDSVGNSDYTGELQCGHEYAVPTPNKDTQKAFCKSHSSFRGMVDVYHGEIQTVMYSFGGSGTEYVDGEFAKARAQLGQTMGIPSEETTLSAKWKAADGSFAHLYARAASPSNGWWDFQLFVAAPNSRRYENGYKLSTAGN